MNKPTNTTKFIIDGKLYDIPNTKVNRLLRDYPEAKAVSARLYKVDNKKYSIPQHLYDKFERQYPNAKNITIPEMKEFGNEINKVVDDNPNKMGEDFWDAIKGSYFDMAAGQYNFFGSFTEIASGWAGWAREKSEEIGGHKNPLLRNAEKYFKTTSDWLRKEAVKMDKKGIKPDSGGVAILMKKLYEQLGALPAMFLTLRGLGLPAFGALTEGGATILENESIKQSLKILENPEGKDDYDIEVAKHTIEELGDEEKSLLLSTVEGGAKGALLHNILKGIQPMKPLTRGVAGAGIFGSQSVVEGGDTLDNLASAIIGFGLAYPGGKGKLLEDLTKDAKKYYRYFDKVKITKTERQEIFDHYNGSKKYNDLSPKAQKAVKDIEDGGATFKDVIKSQQIPRSLKQKVFDMIGIKPKGEKIEVQEDIIQPKTTGKPTRPTAKPEREVAVPEAPKGEKVSKKEAEGVQKEKTKEEKPKGKIIKDIPELESDTHSVEFGEKVREAENKDELITKLKEEYDKRLNSPEMEEVNKVIKDENASQEEKFSAFEKLSKITAENQRYRQAFQVAEGKLDHILEKKKQKGLDESKKKEEKPKKQMVEEKEKGLEAEAKKPTKQAKGKEEDYKKHHIEEAKAASTKILTDIESMPENVKSKIEYVKIFGSVLKKGIKKANDIDIYIKFKNQGNAESNNAVGNYIEEWMSSKIGNKNADYSTESDAGEFLMGFEKGKGILIYGKQAKEKITFKQAEENFKKQEKLGKSLARQAEEFFGYIANKLGITNKNTYRNVRQEWESYHYKNKVNRTNRQVVDDFIAKKTKGEKAQAKGEEEPKTIPKAKGSKGAIRFESGMFDIIKKKGKGYLTSKGNLTKEVFQKKMGLEGRINAVLRDVRNTHADFRRAVRKELKGTPTKETVIEFDNYLKGEEVNINIPEKTKAVLDNMRNQVDVLSQRMIDEGLAEGNLAVTIDENMGVYLNRSYKLHSDPHWAKKVPSKIRNKAKTFIRSKNKDLSENEIEGLINEILYNPKAPMAIIKSSKLGSKDLSMLKKKKDIAPEIRALMGEYTDPLVNYANSVSKMAFALEKHRFLNEVLKEGKNKILFDKPTDDYYAQIAAEGSKVMEPINGLYTTPELKEAFENSIISTEGHPWLEYYSKVNGFVKYSKTVLSQMVHVRNVLAGVYFSALNAHVSPTKFKNAARDIVNDLFMVNNKKARESFKRYVKLKLVDESVHAGEIQDIIQDANENPDFVDGLLESKIKKYKNRALRGVGDLYQAEDNLWRIYFFEHELARYKEAKPDVPIKQLEKEVAELVRNTYQTYSLLPEGVKILRRVPFIGPFVSFPAEVIRTTYNSAAQVGKELKDPNPKIKKIGAQRGAGFITGMLGAIAASSATAFYFGINDDKEKAIRRFAPPWSKNSNLLYTSKIEKGEGQYINMGYVDPHSYLKDPIRAALLTEGNLFKKGLAYTEEVLKPFISEEILFGKLADVRSNKKRSGAPIYNPTDPVGDRLSDSFKYIAEAFEPGTITSYNKMWLAYQNKRSKSGQKFNLKNEIIATYLGHRFEYIDVVRSMLFKSRDYKEQMRNVRFGHRKTFRYEKDEVDTKRTEKQLLDIADEMKKDYDAAILLGGNKKEIRKAMKDGGAPLYLINYVERKISEDLLKKLMMHSIKKFEFEHERKLGDK